MRAFEITLLAIAAFATIATLGIWLATDHHSYTKYQVVEQVTVKNPSDDIFADTGLFGDQNERVETRTRDEFHLGLLPTPQGIFDKHAVSVVTILGPIWALCLGMIFIKRKKAKGTHASKIKKQSQSITTS